VGQVRGYAERQLRHPEDPNSASNRRISVIVQYLEAKAEAGKPAESKPEPPKPAPPPTAPAPAPQNKDPQILPEARK
jgi:hypothetical protein